MTDPIHEQLSAFLDGELSAAESELLLKRVERDPDLKVRLERYVLAGEALRATTVQARPSRDFSARVAAAIDHESVSGRARKHVAQWLKPVVGGAIAAGVAAVALVSFQVPMLGSQDATQSGVAAVTPIQSPDNQSQSNQNAVSQTLAAQASSSGASYIVPVPERRVAPPIQVVNNGRLANFVVAHSEYSSPLGRRNVLTGLVAEDVPTDQPVEQFVVEQLALDESVLPPPVQKPATSRGMLSSAPR